MPKIKLTKGELKLQRDALRQFQRYLPTLQLKKQQLQMEILHRINLLEDKKRNQAAKAKAIEVWAGLLADPGVDIRSWVRPARVNSETKNIAGVDIPVFSGVEFAPAVYDIFALPLWVDGAIERLKEYVSLREEETTLEKSIEILKHELRITSQRVNLFEKVKIPEAEENIRLIKICIGDQMANAVGRSKIAKKKLQAKELVEGVAAS